MHVEGGEGFACQVCYAVIELVVSCRDKAALLAVKGVTDRELGLTAVALCWEVRGAQGHTAGRGRHAIPVLPDPSHLLWTAALSSMPWSLLLVDRGPL